MNFPALTPSPNFQATPILLPFFVRPFHSRYLLEKWEPIRVKWVYCSLNWVLCPEGQFSPRSSNPPIGLEILMCIIFNPLGKWKQLLSFCAFQGQFQILNGRSNSGLPIILQSENVHGLPDFSPLFSYFNLPNKRTIMTTEF